MMTLRGLSLSDVPWRAGIDGDCAPPPPPLDGLCSITLVPGASQSCEEAVASSLGSTRLGWGLLAGCPLGS